MASVNRREHKRNVNIQKRWCAFKRYLANPQFVWQLLRYSLLILIYFPRFVFLRVRKKKIIAFDWQWPHYESFYTPVYNYLQSHDSQYDITFFFRFELGKNRRLPILRKGLPAIYKNFLDRKLVIAADCSRYKSLPGTYRAQMFHGFASFGSGFPVEDFIEPFDVFFMPTRFLYRQFLEEYREIAIDKQLFLTGYPKLDTFIQVIETTQREQRKKTLFYGPTYHRNISSIFDYLPEIVRLCKEKKYRLFIKLHPYLYHKWQFEYSGGIDWVERINQWQRDYSDIVLIDSQTDAQTLAGFFKETDLFLTDVSGIGYEFVLATGRPIIFLGEKLKIPLEDLRAGNLQKYQKYPEIYYRGKIGPVITSPSALGEMVDEQLVNSQYAAQIKTFRAEFVPNLGYASEATVKVITQLLDRIN